ncbi:hypothetical protein PybrP1_007461 [[Pythium] brassicae (nom. inval.)]|nr:hypothetical protein PybrP1_007461 [[Pythium] brassicae (nom. inval.)]
MSSWDDAVLGFSAPHLADAKKSVISWATAHRLLVIFREPARATTSASFTHIPFCLLPVQLPNAQYEDGVEWSPVYCRLVDRVSHDVNWLHKTVSTAVIVFMVQPNEANAINQRWLEHNLWEHHGIKMDAHAGLHDDEQRTLTIANFRAGYTPSYNPSERKWCGRAAIARRFVRGAVDTLLETPFAGLFRLKQYPPATEAVKQTALASSEAYLVDLQRKSDGNNLMMMKLRLESDGNNLYGDEVAHALTTFSPAGLESSILVERIFPKVNPAVLVRNSVTTAGGTFIELDIYTTSLSDDGAEIVIKYAGYLLRKKLSGTDEESVVTGFSVVSSPLPM